MARLAWQLATRTASQAGRQAIGSRVFKGCGAPLCAGLESLPTKASRSGKIRWIDSSGASAIQKVPAFVSGHDVSGHDVSCDDAGGHIVSDQTVSAKPAGSSSTARKRHCADPFMAPSRIARPSHTQ